MLPVFVISLADEKDRRAAMAAHLKTRGFDFEFIDAVDGRQMNVTDHPDYDAKTRRAAHGRDLKPGELGCFLSHRKAYQHIIDQNLDHALLLEDDARLAESTKDVLESFIDKCIDYDIVRLLGSPKVNKSKQRKIIKLTDDIYLTRLRTTPGGAHATLISRQGAQKLLSATKTIAFPIDTVLGRCWDTGINAYSTWPGLAIQDLTYDSAIGEDRHDKTVTPKSLSFKLTRAAFKGEEAFGKAYTYYAARPKDLATRKNFG